MTREEFNEMMKNRRAREEKLKYYFGEIKHKSGVYVYTRVDEKGKRYAYVGQAVDVLQRLAQHDQEFKSHIDKSIKKHGYRYRGRYTGWDIEVTYIDKKYLDNFEKAQIEKYGKTHELYNITAGGQGEGKTYLQPPAPRKGYREGKKAGYEQLRKELQKCLERLEVSPKTSGKLDARALEKFKKIIEGVE